MSYQGQTGPGQSGFPSSAQGTGSQIAGNLGGLQFENKPGASLSGGAAPERNMASGYSGPQGIQEPGYENVSAPSNAGFNQTQGGASFNQTQGGSAYNSSSGGGIGSTYNSSSHGGSSGYQPTSAGGQGTSTTVTGQKPYETAGAKELGIGSGVTSGKAEPGTASIGGGGVNSSTFGATGSGAGSGTGMGSATTTPPSSTTAGGGVYQQAKETAAPYIAKAQETAAPYVAKAQETAGPYVAKAQETAGPYVAKAQELGSSALDSARPALNQAAAVAGQAYNAAANELDARGINRDTTQQKLAEVGQTMKDYGAVGQQRAGEYFSQAVDQAKTIGQDRENKSIVATIFGTVFLVWLAFGFSIGAVFALGVAGSIAAVLSRYSRAHSSSQTGQYSSSQPSSTLGGSHTGQYSSSQPSSTLGGSHTGQYSSSQPSSTLGGSQTGQYSSSQPSSAQYSQLPSGAKGTQSTSGPNTSGVETHYPRPAHPDNSLNTNMGK